MSMILSLAFLFAKADFGSAVLAEAKPLLGVPYVANTLDQQLIEKVTVNPDALDCVTFVELALARARAKLTGNTVLIETETTRYWNGKCDGYPSRNHYTTRWIVDNQSRSNIELLFQDQKNPVFSPSDIHFMSRNPDKYPQLKANPELIEWIRDSEIALADAEIQIVPKDKLKDFQKSLKPGDILFFVTTTPGLDFSHLGLVEKVSRGEVHFMHASSKLKKVVRETSLAKYAADQSKCPGFVFARPLAPGTVRK